MVSAGSLYFDIGRFDYQIFINGEFGQESFLILPVMMIFSDMHLVFNFKINISTSLPYFGVKLSCVCLMFAYRKK